jgi:hypothetical protein
MAILTLVVPAIAETETERDERRTEFLRRMTSLAQTTEVRFQQGKRQPHLIATPVFRYDDQPQRFLDATVWLWSDGGRPVAFEKIEATIFDQPRWGYCFTSVSEQLLDVSWGDDHRYRSTKPGISPCRLPGDPSIESRALARKLQARRLARQFSARITTDPSTNATEQM